MLKVTTPVVVLLAPFAGCFNEPVHATFCVMVVAWIACLGRRTISRVWQTTGQAGDSDHSRAYRLFNQAAWNWDDIAPRLAQAKKLDLGLVKATDAQ